MYAYTDVQYAKVTNLLQNDNLVIYLVYLKKNKKIDTCLYYTGIVSIYIHNK